MFNKVSRIMDITIDGEYYEINLENNIGFLLDKKYKYEPKIGDEIRTCAVDGSGIRGIYANGKKIFYKTNEQLRQERHAMFKEYVDRYAI